MDIFQKQKIQTREDKVEPDEVIFLCPYYGNKVYKDELELENDNYKLYTKIEGADKYIKLANVEVRHLMIAKPLNQ